MGSKRFSEDGGKLYTLFADMVYREELKILKRKQVNKKLIGVTADTYEYTGNVLE